jgi:hypothetical protein
VERPTETPGLLMAPDRVARETVTALLAEKQQSVSICIYFRLNVLMGFTSKPVSDIN